MPITQDPQLKNEKVNHGFIAPVVKEEDYLFGSGEVSVSEPLQKNSDWTNYLPPEEDQNLRKIETYNCTAFGITNQIEPYMKRKFDVSANYADRWVGLISGTKAGGNDPNVVYEAIRKYGLVPEEMCPFSDDIKTVDDYFSWKGVDKAACFAEGKRWLAKYKFTHDWVANGKEVSIYLLRTALQYSPICVAVYAWARSANDIYVRLGEDEHWTMLYVIDSGNEIFDSYDPNYKKLALDFGFRFAKRINITMNTDAPSSFFWKKVVEFFIKIFTRT